jgi:hypothetical protein
MSIDCILNSTVAIAPQYTAQLMSKNTSGLAKGLAKNKKTPVKNQGLNQGASTNSFF